MTKKKKKNKGRVISVDFSGTSTRARVPEGDYLVKVVEITEEIGQDSGKPFLSWSLEITTGKFVGKRLRHITSLQPQALFNLRNTLEALNVEVPDSVSDIDLDALEGMEMGVGVEVETYQGNKQSKVVDVFPEEELEEEEEADEEADEEEAEEEAEEEEEEDEEEDEEDEDEGEEDEDEEDYEDMNKKELKELCKERKIKVPKKATKEDMVELLEEYDEDL